MAGIVAALNNNGYAVASAAGGWGDGTQQPTGNGVKIMALRIGWADVFDVRDGFVSMDYAAQALVYAADNGAHLVNASWGSSNIFNFGEAVDYFLASGGIIFKAAGNSGLNSADYLGTREDIVNVAATGKQDPFIVQRNDCKAWFSNYGEWIDIAAPGVEILSTWHNLYDPDFDYVRVMDGTSMASPCALSVAALIWSQNPSWTADLVKQHLFNTADPIDDLGCNSAYVGQLGAGRVNAFNAVGRCENNTEGNDNDVDGKDFVEFIDDYTAGDLGTYEVAVFASDFSRTNCP